MRATAAAVQPAAAQTPRLVEQLGHPARRHVEPRREVLDQLEPRCATDPDLGVGMPYFLAWALGYGAGTVVEASYEYGNTFLIVSGLLNFLVILDAFDLALGLK